MTELSKIEFLIILCFYKLEKNKNIDLFAQKFNKYFSRDISAQTLLFEVSRFKNIDPATNNANSPKDSIHYKLWEEYIQNDHIDDLKSLYKLFKSEKLLKEEHSVTFQHDYILNLDSNNHVIIEDIPKNIPNLKITKETNVSRDKNVVENALIAANFSCEANCNNPLFTRKNKKINYTEAHHLVPLKHQNLFDVSLDVEANVVSLCPYCHRLLHYGTDYETLLETLFTFRKNRLKKCGITISIEELLLMYR